MADQQAIPASAVLVEKQRGFAVGTCPRSESRGLQFHECHEAVNLGLIGHEAREDATEALGLLAQGVALTSDNDSGRRCRAGFALARGAGR